VPGPFFWYCCLSFRKRNWICTEMHGVNFSEIRMLLVCDESLLVAQVRHRKHPFNND
jgi:hypothetical protein